MQCSRLDNPRDGGAWLAAVYGVAQSDMTEATQQQQQQQQVMCYPKPILTVEPFPYLKIQSTKEMLANKNDFFP